MSVKIATVPCLSDNYAYLLHDTQTEATALVDAPEAEPVREALDRYGWRLTHILLTHHHHDHIEGVADLRGGAQVIGAKADAGRLPALDLALAPGEAFHFSGHEVHIIDTPGHTLGHIAYHIPALKLLFPGDTLFAMGCGRVFEGSMEQMWASLERLAELPPETSVYFGHEYTAANARFAVEAEPDNPDLKARAEEVFALADKGEHTTPTTIARELKTNPFLRAGSADEFARRRQLKDNA